MLKIEIDAHQAKNIESRSGNKNGKDWAMKSQSMWLYRKGSKHPVEIKLVLPEGHNGYPEGFFSIDFENAVISGSFNQPQLDTRKLTLVSLPAK